MDQFSNVRQDRLRKVSRLRNERIHSGIFFCHTILRRIASAGFDWFRLFDNEPNFSAAARKRKCGRPDRIVHDAAHRPERIVYDAARRPMQLTNAKQQVV